jgi:hypothetical protein
LFVRNFPTRTSTADIVKSIPQTITSQSQVTIKERIIKNSHADIVKAIEKTRTAQAAVAKIATYTRDSASRVYVPGLGTALSKSVINKLSEYNITSRALIQGNFLDGYTLIHSFLNTRTITSQARMFQSVYPTRTSHSDVIKLIEQNVTSQSRIGNIERYHINSQAAISYTQPTDKQSFSDILKTIEKVIQSNSRVVYPGGTSIAGRAQIQTPFESSITSQAYIVSLFLDKYDLQYSWYGASNIENRSTILNEVRRTITAHALIEDKSSRNSFSDIVKLAEQTTTARASIQKKAEQSVTAKSLVYNDSLEVGGYPSLNAYTVSSIIRVVKATTAKAAVLKTYAESKTAKASVLDTFRSTKTGRSYVDFHIYSRAWIIISEPGRFGYDDLAWSKYDAGAFYDRGIFKIHSYSDIQKKIEQTVLSVNRIVKEFYGTKESRSRMVKAFEGHITSRASLLSNVFPEITDREHKPVFSFSVKARPVIKVFTMDLTVRPPVIRPAQPDLNTRAKPTLKVYQFDITPRYARRTYAFGLLKRKEYEVFVFDLKRRVI